jgi:hypothetical protein
VQQAAGSKDGATRAFKILQTWAEEQAGGVPDAPGATPVICEFDMKNAFNEANPQAVMDHLAGVAITGYDYDDNSIPRVKKGARIPHGAGECGLNLGSVMAGVRAAYGEGSVLEHFVPVFVILVRAFCTEEAGLFVTYCTRSLRLRCKSFEHCPLNTPRIILCAPFFVKASLTGSFKHAQNSLAALANSEGT